MFTTPALKSLILLAAVLVGISASPLSSLETRTLYPTGTTINSNCAAAGIIDAPFCDVQYFSYANVAETGLDPNNACGAFEDQCDKHTRVGSSLFPVIKVCKDDTTNKVIKASCVQHRCDMRKVYSYTGMVAVEVPTTKEGQSAFQPVVPCGARYCHPLTSMSQTTPMLFADEDGQIGQICRTID